MRVCNYCGKIEYPLICFQTHYLCKTCKRNGITEEQAKTSFKKRIVETFGKKRAKELMGEY